MAIPTSLRRLLPGVRRALGGAALGAGAAAWLAHSAVSAEHAAEPSSPAPPPPAEAEPPRYALYLPQASRQALAKLATPPTRAHATPLGERVSGVPALSADEGAGDGELEVLAVASDGATQSALVSVPLPYAEGARLSHVVLSAPAGVDPEVAEAAAEALWNALEASGRLIIDRTRDGAPRHARLNTGQPEWEGVLSRGHSVTVKAPRKGAPLALAKLPVVACAPDAWENGACVRECGFCKFMKGGPCREQFIAWETCVERCRNEGCDFIEECGQQTLALKACTDEHPEYYGALMADAEEKAAERAVAAAAADSYDASIMGDEVAADADAAAKPAPAAPA